MYKFAKHNFNAFVPQVPQDAQDYKDELKRIQDYVVDLHQKVMQTCDSFSEDVKFWAEYKTGIKGFKPWLVDAEKKSHEGLSKPQTLDEANAMFAVVKAFDAGCIKHLKVIIFYKNYNLDLYALIKPITKSFLFFNDYETL